MSTHHQLVTVLSGVVVCLFVCVFAIPVRHFSLFFIVSLGIFIQAVYIALYERSYNKNYTPSRPLWEVKSCLAQLVVRWVTTCEAWVLFVFSLFFVVVFNSFLLFLLIHKDKLISCQKGSCCLLSPNYSGDSRTTNQSSHNQPIYHCTTNGYPSSKNHQINYN